MATNPAGKATSRAYSQTSGGDNLNGPGDQTTRRYNANKGGGGTWRNQNGTTLGVSGSEDSAYTPMKETGDSPLANLKPRPNAPMSSRMGSKAYPRNADNEELAIVNQNKTPLMKAARTARLSRMKG